jgi:DNA-binding LytR/AlgR family response regulator
MTNPSLRILVVEDDFLTAQRLANEIRANGDHVVGPFADVHDAIHRVGLVQAAILDVRVQDETSFLVADSLIHGGIPFVFLTGYDRHQIPSRFSARVFSKPSGAAPLLDNLHREYDRLAHQQNDSIEMVVLEMMHLARDMMPDEASVERLVEAVLLRAIREQGEGSAPQDVRGWLLHLLDREHRERGRNHLQ